MFHFNFLNKFSFEIIQELSPFSKKHKVIKLAYHSLLLAHKHARNRLPFLETEVIEMFEHSLIAY